MGRGGGTVMTAEGAHELSRFRALLADRLGWAFADTDDAHLMRVMDQHAERLGLGRAGYLRRLATAAGDRELAALAEDLTITETYFFRHGEQFRALAETALPARWHARVDQRVLRMLSVGCSSGEEAYTLAIVAHQEQPDPAWQICVLGLDANPAVLGRATQGRYSAWALRETPDAVRERWFRHRGNSYEVDPRLRSTVQFRRYNVADPEPALWHSEQYDVIFCRNLLMYLTPVTAATLVGRMTRALAPGGYLFLGHTDTLGSRPDGLEPQHTHGTFYYRRPAAAPAPRPGPCTPLPPIAAPPERPAPAAARDRAMTLLRGERFAEALAAMQDGLTAQPEPADLLLQGVLLTQAGRLEAAEMMCRRLLDVDGLHADAHHLLGVCLEGGAAVDVAIGHYRLAAYLDPEFAMPRLRLGLLARRRGDVATAGAELERALTLLRRERDERVTLFGGGFGRIALSNMCRAELDAVGVVR
jgi:chemotaxis protein methyltransferase CheR